MLRYLYGWSLKPFIYSSVTALMVLTGWAYTDPKLSAICGLAWDCGGVTTGPVRVPLVLALGIGVCRVVSKEVADSTGFGVVTLASLFPILSVLVLGFALKTGLPDPMSRDDFYRPAHRDRVVALFKDQHALIGYTFYQLPEDQQLALFDGSREKMLAFLASLRNDPVRRQAVFGDAPDALARWALAKGTKAQRLAVLGHQPEQPAPPKKGSVCPGPSMWDS
jgi:hypothetical protein